MSKAFSNLLKHINKLSHTDKEQVSQWVKRYVEPSSTVDGRLINEMREVRFKEGFECSRCTSEYINRFGKVNGRQRYRCKACRKTFTDTINTILYRIRKGNEWITFVECMFKGYSLRNQQKLWALLGLHYSICILKKSNVVLVNVNHVSEVVNLHLEG